MERVLICGALLLAGCAQVGSSEVNPSSIYASYYAGYSDDTNQLTFRATFSVGGSIGTSVMLDGPSSVSLDGSPLPGSDDILNQYIYSLSETPNATALAAPHEFVYTDNNGATYTNTVQIPSDVSVDTPSGAVISISGPFNVQWASTDSLDGSDEVLVTLQKSDDSTSASASDYGTGSTSGRVSFSPNQLTPLGTGNFRMLVCRNESLPVQGATEAGGDISVSRCLGEIPVTLSP